MARRPLILGALVALIAVPIVLTMIQAGRGPAPRSSTDVVPDIEATAGPPTTGEPAIPVPTDPCPIRPTGGQAAIAAAIASCPDGTPDLPTLVQFPAGATYRQTDLIEVNDRSNLIIDGGGSTFVSDAPNVDSVRPNWNLVRARNVTIRNMKVVGNFRQTGPRSLPTVSRIAANQRNSGFFLYGGDDVTIADVEVRDIFGDLVTLVPTGWAPTGLTPEVLASSEIPTDVRLVRLHGIRAARQCIAPTAVIGLWLEDSTLRDCWYGGVDLERDMPGEPLRDVHILRNTFDGFNHFAIAVVDAGQDGTTDGIEIRGNRTLTAGDTCGATITVNFDREEPSLIRNVVIEDNDLKTLWHGITLDHVQRGSVRNNRIEKTERDVGCGSRGVPVMTTSSADVVVSGNVAEGY